jgi:hypothetical protein
MTINYDDLQEPFNKFSTLVELLRYRASSQPERIALYFSTRRGSRRSSFNIQGTGSKG